MTNCSTPLRAIPNVDRAGVQRSLTPKPIGTGNVGQCLAISWPSSAWKMRDTGAFAVTDSASPLGSLILDDMGRVPIQASYSLSSYHHGENSIAKVQD
jgi:hypothetical protein